MIRKQQGRWILRTAMAMDRVGENERAVRQALRSRWGRAPRNLESFIASIQRLR